MLTLAAVVLEGQDDRIVGGDKGSVAQSVDHILEQDVSAHRFAVSDYRLFILPLAVPAVELHAPLHIKVTSHIYFFNIYYNNLKTGDILLELESPTSPVNDRSEFKRPTHVWFCLRQTL